MASSSQPFRRYVCTMCDYIYDEELGDPDGGLPPGTRYEDIPDTWVCPVCGAAKGMLMLLREPQ